MSDYMIWGNGYYIGRVDFYDKEKNISYILMVGYIENNYYRDKNPLYIRLFSEKEQLLCGAWISGVSNNKFFKEYFSQNTLSQCIEQAKRIAKLKVFS